MESREDNGRDQTLDASPLRAASEHPDASIATAAEILVLGAGYGGLHVVQRLSAWLQGEFVGSVPAPRIVLVDRRAYHQLTTELPRLVSGHRQEGDVGLDLRRLIDGKKVRYVQAEVTAIEPGARRVRTSGGEFTYRIVVIALGSISNDFGIPGIREHMRRFLTTEDATDLRAAAAHAVEDAARDALTQPNVDPADLERRVTAIVGGAGATGVEVAGELAEFMKERWQSARRIIADSARVQLPQPRVILIDAGPTILRGWSDRTIAAALDALRELAVDVRLNAMVERVEPGLIHLKGGATLAGGILVWAGGARAPDLLATSGLPAGPAGRVVVDRFQRVPEHPEVYVVGDAALMLDPKTSRPVPPTADLALREGETAAQAIEATLRGQEPERALRPMTRNAVSVGEQRGAANLLGVELRGRAAHTLKDLIEWEYRQSITRLRGNSLATAI